MTKKEFLNTLETHLNHDTRLEKTQILADFDVFFDEGVANHQTEEEICQTLGDPKELAQQLNEELGIGENREVGNASIDSANLDITLYALNLILMPTVQSTFEVKIYQRGKEVEDESIHVLQDEKGVKISQMPPTNFVKRWLLNPLDFKKMIISVPQDFSGNIRITDRHGNIELNNLQPQQVLIDSYSGNLQLNEVRAQEEIHLLSRSGNIKQRNCEGKTDIQSISGNVSVENHTGSVTVIAKSGNVMVETNEVSLDSRVETTSGNIQLMVDKLTADLAVQVISGNIKLAVRQVHGNILATAKSGNVNAALDASLQAVFAIQSSGIKNEFSQQLAPNQTLPLIQLSSKSGNVKVKKL